MLPVPLRSPSWFAPGLALCLAVAAPTPVVPALAATLEVGAGKPYATPSDAAAMAHDGDRVVIAAGSYFDCAIWRANNLTIEGAGPEATVITDKTCEGKALFITRGNSITIRNLTLTRARVPDFNGAGIRAEGGDLLIEHVRFVNNQNGILAGDRPNAKMVVRESAFLKNGTCQGGSCAHGLYVGHIALLRVEQTRFAGTREGHDIKSRAQQTDVVGCEFADGPDGTSSYAVEAPNGGGLIVRDSHIEKGPQSQNHTAAISIGAEGITQPTPDIAVEHNVFQVDGDYSSFLVNNISATEAALKGNTLRGNAKALRGDGSVQQ